MTSVSFDEFLQSVHTLSDTKVREWWEILTSMMGSNSEAISQWNNIFITHINDLFEDMIDEALRKRSEILNKIEELLKRSSLLCKELNVKMPNYGSEGLTLYEEQKYLIAKIAEYEEKIESVKKEIKQLNKEEHSLTKSLGEISNPLPSDPLPTPETISAFKTHLELLESLKFEREEKFLNIKSEILDLVEELNYEPELDFERMVISLDDSLFIVSDNNMSRIIDFLSSLKALAIKIKEDISILKEKLRSLWSLLNEDLKTCDEFLKKNSANNRNTLKALQNEVVRCENLKKANIEVFVTRLRKDLVSLWDKCHFTEAERNEFEYFHSDTYSEDLLSIHDMQITKLNSYYESNSALFKLLEKRSELWHRMLELEESASMPGRFKNRGGQLLKEEKERNALLKRLPKIEEQMILLADTFALKHKKPFYSWGKTIEEIISESHNAHDEDRKLKLSARKQKRELTITPCKLTSSVSTLNLAVQTPQTGTKRKLLAPAGPLSSNKRILGEHHTNARTAPSKLVYGKLSGRSHLSVERAKRIEKCRRISMKKLQKENISCEYDVFEKELSNKDECRSTIFKGIENETLLAVPLPVTPNSKCNNNAPNFSTAPNFEF